MLKKKYKLFRIANFRPIPFILIGLVSGIIICICEFIVACIVLGIIALFCLVLSFATDIKKVFLILFITAVFLGGLTINISFAVYSTNLTSNYETAEISARIKGVNSYYSDSGEIESMRIIVDNVMINGELINGSAYLYTQNTTEYYEIGQELLINGSLNQLDFEVTDSKFMSKFNDGIYYYISPSIIKKGDSNSLNRAEKVRRSVYNKLSKSFDARIAGFCYSMLFGDKSYIFREDIENFQATGTAHVFAVSGLHVGVLAGVIILLLKKLKANNRIILIITTFFLVFYAFLASFSPSVVRAGIMVIIMLIAKAIGRRNDILSTVCLTAFLTLLFCPFWLFDISFLLSFSAVFGIILLYNPISRLLKRLKYLNKAIALNLSVNIGILPFVLLFFGSFSILTLPANLIIIPVISLVYILLILHLLCSFLLPFILIFGGIIKPLVAFCIDFVAGIARVPNSIVDTEVHYWIFIPYYFGIFFFSDYYLLKKPYKYAIASLIFILYTFTFIIVML